MTATPVTIGGIDFPTKSAATFHARKILYRDELKTKIACEDSTFVKALFYARLDKVEALNGRRITEFHRDMHRHNTPCFIAIIEDGDKLDFSVKKSIDLLSAK